MAGSEHVPVGEAGTGSAGVGKAVEEGLGGLFTHVFEDVAEVEGIIFFGIEGIFDWRFDDCEAVLFERSTNFFVRFPLEGEGEDFAVGTSEDPVEVGILRWVESGKGVFRAGENTVGDGTLDEVKKSGVSSKATHDESGEEGLEDETPAAVVPGVEMKIFALGPGLGLKELGDTAAIVSEGKDPGSEEVEVTFEFSGGGSDGFQEVVVVEVEIGVLADFDALDLSGIHFNGGVMGGSGGEEGEGVVTSGADGEAASATREEGFDEDVGVFPALAVADLGEVGTGLDFGEHS